MHRGVRLGEARNPGLPTWLRRRPSARDGRTGFCFCRQVMTSRWSLPQRESSARQIHPQCQRRQFVGFGVTGGHSPRTSGPFVPGFASSPQVGSSADALLATTARDTDLEEVDHHAIGTPRDSTVSVGQGSVQDIILAAGSPVEAVAGAVPRG